MSVFFIAEAGVNHNGDLGRALEMVDVAAAARADAIKFQTFTAATLAGPAAAKAAYQQRETGDGGQLEMLTALELSEDNHRRLFDRRAQAGIEFMSTPFDEAAADFLVGLGMQRLKVPSGEIVNLDYLRHLAGFDLPIVLSTGMATMAEVEEAVATIREERAARGFAAPLEERLTVLHCTSNYPAAPGEVNLRAMDTIASGTGMPVGYSDHTLGSTVTIAAVARGARVIEKHFTLDRTLPGPDHRASLEPDELGALIAAIRDTEIALGSSEKAPGAAELAVRAVARRSVCAARDLDEGHELEADDLVLVRPGTGIAPKHRAGVVGKRLARSLAAGDPLSWDDLA